MHGKSVEARLEPVLPRELAFLKDCPEDFIKKVQRVVRNAHRDSYRLRRGYKNEREAWDDSTYNERFEELIIYVSNQGSRKQTR